MFWSKRSREFNLQLELDGYAADIEELIEIAHANARRAFVESHRNEWNYWRSRTDTLPKIRGYIDHARGARSTGFERSGVTWRRPRTPDHTDATFHVVMTDSLSPSLTT